VHDTKDAAAAIAAAKATAKKEATACDRAGPRPASRPIASAPPAGGEGDAVMATSWTQTDLDALEAAIKKGVRSVSYATTASSTARSTRC
jgi:hypothetical protein